MSASSTRLAGCAFLAIACGGPAATTPGSKVPPGPPVFMETPVRLWSRAPGRVVGAAADGGSRVLRRGQRQEEAPDGSVRAADGWLPDVPDLQAMALPERLGGGWLFSSAARGDLRLWRADEWLGPVRPLARLEGSIQEVGFGSDRLLLFDRGSGDVFGLSAVTGEAMARGPVPRASALWSLAFADAWFGVAVVPLRGALVTFDAGVTWRPLGIDATRVTPAAEGVRLTTSTGRFVLDAEGSLQPEAPEVPPPAPRERLLRGVDLLAEAALRGVAAGGDAAWVVVEGRPWLVSLATAARVHEGEGLEGLGGCVGLRVKEAPGFACDAPGGGTLLARLAEGRRWEVVAEFSGPRRVNGAAAGVMVDGGCPGARPRAGRHCVIPARGEPFELRLTGEHVRARVVPLHGSAAAVLVPPREDGAGELLQVGPRGVVARHPLRLPASRAAREALTLGFWLEGFELSGRSLVGFLLGRNAWYGVKVDLEGTVELRRPIVQPSLLISGPRALALGRGRGAFETRDAGETWSDVSLGSGEEPVSVGRPGEVRGCGALGCVVGDVVRLGWGRREPEVVGDPAPTRLLDAAGLGRWNYRCHALPSPPPVGSISRAPGARDVVFDVAVDALTSRPILTVWGPRDDDWTRAGAARVTLRDRFAVRDMLTRSSASPWPARASAEAALRDWRGSAPWYAVSDASGTLNVLGSMVRGQVFLALAAPDRPIAWVTRAQHHGVERVGSVALVGGVPHLAVEQGGTLFRVFRVAGEDLVALADLDLGERGRGPGFSPQIVTDTGGSRLGIWVQSRRFRGSQRSWFLHPLDPLTGSVGEPLVLEPGDLDDTPPPCAPGARGWVLAGAPPLEPALDLPVRARRVMARMIWAPDGLCVDALAAESETVPAREAPRTVRARGTPLALGVPGTSGLRLPYWCAGG